MNRKRILFIAMTIVAAFAFSSCGTTKSSITSTTPSNKASIYIKRPPFVGAAWVHYMDLEDIYLGQVKGGDCIRIDVDPGTYVLNYYNGSMMTYDQAKQNGASFTKTFSLAAGEKKFIRIVIKPVEITCVDENGSSGYSKINNTIDFSVLQKKFESGSEATTTQQRQLPREEPNNQVLGYGNTALENTIVRWDIQSRPQGADVFWRVVSTTPGVKSTNNKYLMTTPYEATKALDIKGLTYQTSGNVRIILRCEKDGYMPQEKEFDVRMVLDQEEISAFFRLVKDE